MLKKVTPLYVAIFVIAIISGVYFVFASSQVVTLTAIVPDENSDVVVDVASPDSVVLGWSHSALSSIQSDDTDDDHDDKLEDKTEDKTEDVVKVENTRVSDVSKNSLRPPAFLTRFSVMVFWYKRENPPAEADLNSDGRVNIIDFSILAFNGGLSL